ncbi:Oidioi.mRNA.OKI2018_I69.chr1.g3901.t1.cds [Oikopleura dioica]|uniref:Oidioi.mRNA.OKI2018_I69.chr1.g3901.t1.cds n=1 Tax=Oikopleura dioica TaxID=34765 RepID=A0ABN7T235_OIKDI|nr:Oidioi.mRNA.OKI2018_I69.chr1.g3901.t1.cds [Oikopleura dioica]
MAEANDDDASNSWLNDLLQTLNKVDNAYLILLVGLVLVIMLVVVVAICIKIFCCASTRKFPSTSGTKCVRHQQSMTSPLDSPIRGIMTQPAPEATMLSTQVAQQSEVPAYASPLPLTNQISSSSNAQQNPTVNTFDTQNEQITSTNRRQRAPSLQSLPDAQYSYREYQPCERLLKRQAQTLPTPTNRRSSRPGTGGNLAGDCPTVGGSNSRAGSRDHIVGRLSECPDSIPLLVKSRALVHHPADENIDGIDPARSGVPNGTGAPQGTTSKKTVPPLPLPATSTTNANKNLTPDDLKPEVAFNSPTAPILTAAIPPTRREATISKAEMPCKAGAGSASRQQNQWWFVSLDHVTPSPLNHDN